MFCTSKTVYASNLKGFYIAARHTPKSQTVEGWGTSSHELLGEALYCRSNNAHPDKICIKKII